MTLAPRVSSLTRVCDGLLGRGHEERDGWRLKEMLTGGHMPQWHFMWALVVQQDKNPIETAMG